MPDPRRFGRIRLRDDPRNEPPVSNLGFDPLLNLPGPATFRRLLGTRGVTTKGLLLDQSFAAGVGNWIADEVLYQAGIAPHRRVRELETAEIESIRRRLGSVIRKAVAVNAASSRFPKTWLFHHRWGRPEDARTHRGEAIEITTVAGRTTAWVPSAQR
jgi:formamidopyrimidine-DNA glycosylase